MAWPIMPSPKKPTVGPVTVVPFCVSTISSASVLASKAAVADWSKGADTRRGANALSKP
jgi:hypothetical protein